MKRTVRSKYGVLFLLVLIFAAPGLAAYIVYHHPAWLGATSNRGQLLNPPELVSTLKNNTPKWRLVFWNPDVCNQSCQQQIDKLARIRLALGRRLYDVKEILILPEEYPLSTALKTRLREQDIDFLSMAKGQQANYFTEQARVFIANPENYLVLAYSLTAKSEDIYHDLRQLLNTAEKNSV